jgi:uncharacterized protein YkwD
MCPSMRRLSWVSAILVALALALAPPVTAGPAESVLSAINAARAKAGCGPLRVNPKLMAAARTHAKAMAEQNFFGHAGKDGSRMSSRIKRQGYSFRRNILNCRMEETGIALVYQSDDRPLRGNRAPLRYYWVQVFADPA